MNSVQTQVVDDYIKKAEGLKKELEGAISENSNMFQQYLQAKGAAESFQKILDSGSGTISLKAVFAKLGLIQSEVEGVTKSAFLKLGDRSGYKYVPWTALVEMIEPLLGKHKVILETIPMDMKTEWKNNNIEANFYCRHKFIDCDSGESYTTPSEWLASGAAKDSAKAIKAAMSNEKATFLQSFFNVPVENETTEERVIRESDVKNTVEKLSKVFPETKIEVSGPTASATEVIINENEKKEWFNKFKGELDGDKETVNLWLSLTKPWKNGERIKTNELTKEMFSEDMNIFSKPKLAQAVLMLSQAIMNNKKIEDPSKVYKRVLEESGKNKLSEFSVEEVSKLLETLNNF